VFGGDGPDDVEHGIGTVGFDEREVHPGLGPA
jgi:hypothetical protein